MAFMGRCLGGGVDEVQVALAFVARRAGRSAMDEAAWAHVMSLELGWMAPAEARALVARAVQAGLLRDEAGLLALAFDAKSVTIPRGFRPSAATRAATQAPAAAAAEDPFVAWLGRVAASTGRGQDEVLADVARLQDEARGLLHAEAALLRVAHAAGLDVRDAAAAALTRLVAESPAR